MFSIITMASSTTKPVEMVSAIKVRLFRLKPRAYIAPKVPTSDSGNGHTGDDGRREGAQRRRK